MTSPRNRVFAGVSEVRTTTRSYWIGGPASPDGVCVRVRERPMLVVRPGFSQRYTMAVGKRVHDCELNSTSICVQEAGHFLGRRKEWGGRTVRV